MLTAVFLPSGQTPKTPKITSVIKMNTQVTLTRYKEPAPPPPPPKKKQGFTHTTCLPVSTPRGIMFSYEETQKAWDPRLPKGDSLIDMQGFIPLGYSVG